MPISWNEIRSRAITFVREWNDAESEHAESQSFWDAFFLVFGVPRRRVASFEKHVKTLDGKQGFIDLLWKGMLLIEHKSRGRDLDIAYQQALSYFPGLKDRDLPRYVLVSDFARFRLRDLENDTETSFTLRELPLRIKHFAFIAGYTPQAIREQDPVNIRAAEQMGRLHDQLKNAGYGGHELEVLLVRILFCLFADGTGIFETQGFRAWLELRTAEDGSDMGPRLAELFQVLNTEVARRQRTLDEQLAAFPYINGDLFREGLHIAAFNTEMRATLLDCCALNWATISPAIFGALFQSILDPKARRNLGAHYTSERNILKVIKPLFLDSLWAEFQSIKSNRRQLSDFHQKLRKLKFLDPACGCGNFLVISYRELRLLELEVLRASFAGGQRELDIQRVALLNVDQFFGIEIEEFPSQIAQVALWLVDHQANVTVAEEFGQYFVRIPLTTSPHIHCDNALRRDWASIISPDQCSYLLGNPPFVGKALQTREQKADLASVSRGIRGAGVLDLVCAWYIKAANYIQGTDIRCALVATNSITQGEQVGILWSYLLANGIKIHFAHRTFKWTNEARGVAAVHCVIVGFGCAPSGNKVIFEYDRVDGEPHALNVNNINPYLLDAPDTLLLNRRDPLSTSVPEMRFGSMANDGGHLLLSDDEKRDLVSQEPNSERWIRPFMQVDELLYGSKRWCLWLQGIAPAELRGLPIVSEKVARVREYRLASLRETTRELARFPTLFGEIRQPETDYYIVPRHTGEDRKFIPIARFSPDVICGDANLLIADPSLYAFGVIESTMHMAWMRIVCGRIKSDYRYSVGIVYNNFPWPSSLSERQIDAIAGAAQAVLDARARYPGSTLADLYGLVTMPPDLQVAHDNLDRAVDIAYIADGGKRNWSGDVDRVSFLFRRYEALHSPLAPTGAPRSGQGRRSRSH